MSRRNIKRFSFRFELVLLVGAIYHQFYYRRFIVKNRGKIPSGKPVIFAANHQNALMDALAIIFAARRQIVFMARADIFRKKFTARLLHFIKILPVYRIRDGFHSVEQNKDVFKEVIAVLENNNPVALFPEGSHLGEKRLRQFKKGAARLALLAEESFGEQQDVVIVPVGLDYSGYKNAGADLLVVFGDPIPAGGFKELYLQNPPQALNELTDVIAEGMKKVVIHIDTEEYYRTILDAVEMYCPQKLKKQHLRPTLWNCFLIKKEISEKLVSKIIDKKNEINELKQLLDNYRDKLKNLNLRDRQISRPLRNRAYLFMKFSLFLLASPLFLLGTLLNFLPYYLPIRFARNLKDPHFISSVRFSAGLPLFLLWYIVGFIVFIIVFKNIFLSLALLAFLPLSGLFAFYYYKNYKKMLADIRWMRIKYGRRDLFVTIIELRNKIISTVSNMIST
jgi:1-acyl-sn-glycerol-3-phosphate acyltransferase